MLVLGRHRVESSVGEAFCEDIPYRSMYLSDIFARYSIRNSSTTVIEEILHFSAFGPDISKRIQHMGEFIHRQVLRLMISSINCPEK